VGDVNRMLAQTLLFPLFTFCFGFSLGLSLNNGHCLLTFCQVPPLDIRRNDQRHRILPVSSVIVQHFVARLDAGSI
jgi:hypothetical protein